MIVKEEVHKKLDGCRLFGNESFSDIIDRISTFYMDNYSGSEKVVPKFVMDDIHNNKIDLSRAKEVVLDDDVKHTYPDKDIEFPSSTDNKESEPVNSFSGINIQQ